MDDDGWVGTAFYYDKLQEGSTTNCMLHYYYLLFVDTPRVIDSLISPLVLPAGATYSLNYSSTVDSKSRLLSQRSAAFIHSNHYR